MGTGYLSGGTARASEPTVPSFVGADLDVPSVRLVEAHSGRRAVVELTSPVTNNPLYHAYRALRSLGVMILHTEVRALGDRLIQKLHLVELNGRALDPNRVSAVLATLRAPQWMTFDEPSTSTLAFA